jgi:hypothetical protein
MQFIVSKAILEEMDMRTYHSVLDKEKQDREELKKLIKNL